MMESPRFFALFMTRIFNRTNRIILLLLFFIGAIIGAVTVYMNERVYSSSMVVESPFIKNEILTGLIADVRALVVEEEYEYAAGKLELPINRVTCLRNLITDQIEEIEEGKVQVSNRFIIKVLTDSKNVALIDSTKTGIINLLENNDYIKEQINIERERLTAYKAEIEKKIEELEALQVKSLDQIEVTQDLFSYHTQIVGLYDKKSELDKQLQSSRALFIISNDTFPIKVEPDYITLSLIYALSFLVFWMIIVFIGAFVQAPDQPVPEE